MKKNTIRTVFTTAAVIAAMSSGASVYAAEDVQVYVTISDGSLAMANEEITVSDIDGDGALTINDALYCAHEAAYEGGAEAGYGSYEGDYGLALSKLWGIENGGSYGYYVNNTSAMSLGDTISSGDHINAFVYTDLTAWSDTYCYFDNFTVSADAGSEIALTLSAASFDENYAPVTIPVENAVITINGEKTDFITDAEGKAVITINDAGKAVISAVSDSMTLVPPVCAADISASAAAPSDSTTAPAKTGNHSSAAAVMAVSLLVIAAMRKNEK